MADLELLFEVEGEEDGFDCELQHQSSGRADGDSGLHLKCEVKQDESCPDVKPEPVIIIDSSDSEGCEEWLTPTHEHSTIGEEQQSMIREEEQSTVREQDQQISNRTHGTDQAREASKTTEEIHEYGDAGLRLKCEVKQDESCPDVKPEPVVIIDSSDSEGCEEWLTPPQEHSTIGEMEQSMVGEKEQSAVREEDQQMSNRTDGTNQARNTPKKTEKIYECEECKKRFFNRNFYLMHRRKHTSDNLFVCEICKEKFELFTGLKKHEETHGNRSVAVGRVSSKGDVLKRRKVYSCSVCSKNVTSLRALAKHEETHPIYTCSTCNATFRKKKSLLFHEKVHKDPPLQCRYCNDRFSSPEMRRIHHYRSHSDKLPFECAECQNRYRTLSGLRKHLIKHTNEYPFPCNSCDKKFQKSTSLQWHREKCHSYQFYVCDVCRGVFRHRKSFSRHYLKHATSQQGSSS